MRKENIQQLQDIYVPDRIYFETNHSSEFSNNQTEACWAYVNESIITLKKLCSKVVLDIRQILITCCDILEMSTRVPSVAHKSEFLDMSDLVCTTVKSIAARMDEYDIDPKNVTTAMIRKDCDHLAACT
tara:strand:- start:24 stop:410 length:387 start_codon:yes stop_codon:yes gene_type:complete